VWSQLGRGKEENKRQAAMAVSYHGLMHPGEQGEVSESERYDHKQAACLTLKILKQDSMVKI